MNPRLRKGLLLAVGLGVGIGLMIGGGFVEIADSSGPTDEEIKERATELGMVDLATYQPPAVNVPAPQPEVKPEPQPQPTPPPTKEILSFVVVRGMGFGEIGKLLKGAGLPIDPEALSERAQARKVANRAQPGVYSLWINDPARPVTHDAVIDLVIDRQP